MSGSRVRVTLLTTMALVGFAANSLLCRTALGRHLIDAASFTAIRLAAGAAALALLVRLAERPRGPAAGSWIAGLSLFAYAVAFSFSYLRLHAGMGALLLFGAVQLSMVGWGLVAGERPRPTEWIGLVVAFVGLAALSWPGRSAPDPVGAALMVLAGVAWGVYSLRGRGTDRPLAATAHNFARTLPLVLVLVVVTATGRHVSPLGFLLSVVSGAVTSGFCYALWYAALRGLSSTRAAVVQLGVPALAASGGVIILGEPVTLRLLLAGGAILGGIALAIVGHQTVRYSR